MTWEEWLNSVYNIYGGRVTSYSMGGVETDVIALSNGNFSRLVVTTDGLTTGVVALSDLISSEGYILMYL